MPHIQHLRYQAFGLVIAINDLINNTPTYAILYYAASRIAFGLRRGA